MLNTLGHARTRINRHVGKQVHIIPTLTSIVDHHATIHWSHVGFVELAKYMSDCKRRTETTVTLEAEC